MSDAFQRLLRYQVDQMAADIEKNLLAPNPIFNALANDPKLKARSKLIQDLYGHGRNRAALLSALQDLNNEGADTAY